MSTGVTLEGRVGGEPEVRFTKNGKALTKFALVTSKNVKGEDGKWQESETTWWRVTCWDALAENVADSVVKGAHVIVSGRAYTEEWKDREGNARSSLAVNAYNVGLSLKRAKAATKTVERVKAVDAPAENDPWASEDVPPF